MNPSPEQDLMQKLVRRLPRQVIPPDLIASIEAETILKRRWRTSEVFETRWLPALVGVATALGALWLSKAQVHSRPHAAFPVAARPQPGPIVRHARLPQNESSDQEKGETREQPKSSPAGDSTRQKG